MSAPIVSVTNVPGSDTVVCIYADGSKYEGQWRDRMRQKKGKLYYGCGDVYDGEWLDDRAHGFGIFREASGEVYRGDWSDDARQGHGIHYYASGEKEYEGEWKADVYHGQGSLFYESGDVYTGSWVSEVRHGYGTLHYANGDVYDGEWERDRAHGRGTFTERDGKRYEGDWFDDHREGTGVSYYPSGTVEYDGEWHLDTWHGTGVFRSEDGREEYSGQWVTDRRHGTGVRTVRDGPRYDGEWRNGAWHGVGRLLYATGDEYVGEFALGAAHGWGAFTTSDGETYRGQWVRDARCGFGVLTVSVDDPAGGEGSTTEMYCGLWVDDCEHVHASEVDKDDVARLRVLAAAVGTPTAEMLQMRHGRGRGRLPTLLQLQRARSAAAAAGIEADESTYEDPTSEAAVIALGAELVLCGADMDDDDDADPHAVPRESAEANGASESDSSERGGEYRQPSRGTRDRGAVASRASRGSSNDFTLGLRFPPVGNGGAVRGGGAFLNRLGSMGGGGFAAARALATSARGRVRAFPAAVLAGMSESGAIMRGSVASGLRHVQGALRGGGGPSPSAPPPPAPPAPPAPPVLVPTEPPKGSELRALLAQHGLERFLPKLLGADVCDAETLSELSDADLEKIGVDTVGARKKMLAAAKGVVASPCVVCFLGARTMVADPCGHMAVCKGCSVKLTTCPLCRTETSRYIAVFSV